jgi:hypothetical protein
MRPPSKSLNFFAVFETANAVFETQKYQFRSQLYAIFSNIGLGRCDYRSIPTIFCSFSANRLSCVRFPMALSFGLRCPADRLGHFQHRKGIIQRRKENVNVMEGGGGDKPCLFAATSFESCERRLRSVFSCSLSVLRCEYVPYPSDFCLCHSARGTPSLPSAPSWGQKPLCNSNQPLRFASHPSNRSGVFDMPRLPVLCRRLHRDDPCFLFLQSHRAGSPNPAMEHAEHRRQLM